MHKQTKMAEGGEEIDFVVNLQQKPFSRRTFHEKLDIISNDQRMVSLMDL